MWSRKIVPFFILLVALCGQSLFGEDSIGLDLHSQDVCSEKSKCKCDSIVDTTTVNCSALNINNIIGQ